MSLIFILLGTFFLLAFLGVPIAISLGVASGIGMLTAGVSVSGIAQRMFAGVDSFSYLAIPMFMLAGKLMEYGGISARIVQVAKILCAKVRGGLAITSIVACSFFAALSGSAPATVSAIGGIMYPEMLKDGYDEEFAGGMISVAGNLGPLIPPSILMVTIGVCTGVSISDMFLGGIVIGILLAVVFCLTAYVICRRRNYGGSGQTYSSKEKWRIFWSAMPALGMPIIILGGIYSGLFTPTEAAAIAVFYGIIVSAFVYRNMGMKDFLHVLSASASSTASILFLVANAHIFSYLLSSEQIPQKLAILMTSLTTNPTIIMFLIMIVLLIAGCFLDNAVAVILLTPIFVNVVQAMNIDICYFGVFLVFVLAIGQVTPPVGLCLFVACDIGKVSIEKVSREVLPYVGGLIVTAILLVLFPQIGTWLPSLTKMA